MFYKHQQCISTHHELTNLIFERKGESVCLYFSSHLYCVNVIHFFNFKFTLLFPINTFPKKYFKNRATPVIINASYNGICVEFNSKNITTLVFLLSNFRKY